MDATILEPPVAIVPRLIWRGRLAMLATREKGGKTTLVAAGVSAASAGASFLDIPSFESRVLWVALDQHLGDLAPLFTRFRAVPSQVYVIIAPLSQQQLAAAIGECQPDIVVIDTLAEFAGDLVGDASQSAQWQPVLAGLRALCREFDIGMLLLHHAKKNDGGYRDSTAIGAAVDVIIEMRPVLDDPTARTLSYRGRWQVPRTTVRLGATGYELVDGELSLEARIMLYVQGWPGCSTRRIREHIGGRAGEVGEVVRRLEQQGVIQNQGANNASKWHAGSITGSPIGGNAGTTQLGTTTGSQENVSGNQGGTTREPHPEPVHSGSRESSGSRLGNHSIEPQGEAAEERAAIEQEPAA